MSDSLGGFQFIMQMVKGVMAKRVQQVKELPGQAILTVEQVMEIIKLVLSRTLIVLLTVTILVLVSLFIYGSFYFAFVPAPAHKAPLYLSFEPCQDSPSKCGYLNATVNFNLVAGTRSSAPVLMSGQAYSVVVGLRMPESPKNIDLGMFMSCLQMKTDSGEKTIPLR